MKVYILHKTFSNIRRQGRKNAVVSLHVYDVKTGNTQKINLDKYNDFYIARIEWTNDANTLSAQVLNRHQDNLDLLFVDGNSGDNKSRFKRKR